MKNNQDAARRTPTTKGQKIKYCPYCGSTHVTMENNEIFCMKCGTSFVATKRRVRERQFAAYSPLHPPLRVSVDLPLAQSTRTLSLSELDMISRALNLPKKVYETSSSIYSKAAVEKRLTRVISFRSLAAAAIYIACRQDGLAITLEEIAAASGVDKKNIDRAHSLILNEFAYLTRPAPLRMDVTRFLEKKGSYEFLALLKEKPRRWKTLEKELSLSPRSLSERISQALELGLIEKVRRLKIGADYYRLTKNGSDIVEAITKRTRIY